MVDASAFLDELRLCSHRLRDSIELLGLYATTEEIFVHRTLTELVKEIEDGYTTLLRPAEHAAAPQAGVGSAEPERHVDDPSVNW